MLPNQTGCSFYAFELESRQSARLAEKTSWSSFYAFELESRQSVELTVDWESISFYAFELESRQSGIDIDLTPINGTVEK